MGETQKEFTYMSEDIEKLNKKLSKGKIFTVMDKASAKIKGVVEQLKEMEGTLRNASFKIDDLKQNLKQGRNFFDTFKKIMENAPEDVVSRGLKRKESSDSRRLRAHLCSMRSCG
jgi:hypothetical protein